MPRRAPEEAKRPRTKSSSRPLVLLAAALALTAGIAVASQPLEAEKYGLDELDRRAPVEGQMRCPKVDLVEYKGDGVAYSPRAMVYSGFRDRLQKLDEVVREVAIEVYGRAPIKLISLGTYNCRRIGDYPEWLSEHGLGNAIDVAGFDFGPLPKGEKLPEGLPKAFQPGFEVRVLRHWKGTTGHAAVHARFLKTLARRLIAHDEIFRVVLGPGYPGHDNHFHLDAAPYRLVEVFEVDANKKKVRLTGEAKATKKAPAK